MPIGTTGQIIKVVLIVILIILLVIEFFTLFVGLAFVILPGVKKTLVHYGLFMVIVAGLLICLAFVGLCGAVRECYLKLFVFAGLLIAVLLVSLLVHLFMLPPEDDVQEKMLFPNHHMQKTFGIDKRNIENISVYSMKIWDNAHRKFKCCGLNGPNSWLEMNRSIPQSCCHFKDNSSDPISEFCKGSNYGEYVYSKGCAKFQKYEAWKGSIASPSGSAVEGPPDEASNITMVTIIRTAGYFIQLAAVVLAIWLGILILLSYHCGYY
ncbi:23 kDa integral membrane protein-like [Coccinella septempunctata]|uniref:23 kDa integral membrane protein-like n=1 Tax=Coccinella septempunctata TaxID=41139 RepID=UPI001D0635A3|nr:23 kDa integral membrane protein-like [Coccinella septempunctata]